MEQKDINKYIGYCRAVARSAWRRYGDLFSYDELFSAAQEGLAEAINRYDPDRAGFPRYVWEYISGFTHNAVRVRLRDRSRTASDDSALDLVTVSATQQESSEYRQMMSAIKAQIETLPDNERDYAVLVLDGCNDTQAAHLMGVTRQRVGQLRQMVITKLRRWGKQWDRAA
jgi:RNA polymerase sigma factor (sigma-70 family)